MAAVLVSGPSAALSHESAAELLGILPTRRSYIEVTGSGRGRPGLRVHRRASLAADDFGTVDGIPVTSPARTLIDLATRLTADRLEAAVNQADKLDLIDPEALRGEVERRPGQRGVKALRAVLDRRTFRLTDSALERRFLRLVRSAGLPLPQTGRLVNGFKVDFFWPALGLVVETDGLRYHRTAAHQARDRERDLAHAAAGLTALRFTHSQVRHGGAAVVATLRSVTSRLEPSRAAA